MTQLILDTAGESMVLPESIKGGYRAYEEDLSVEAQMISGRLVVEETGAVWRIAYQYGFVSDADRKRLISICRKGRRSPILCAFLPPDSDEMVSSTFYVTSFTEPKFMWSRDGNPLWADYALELREEEPHD